MPVPSSTGSTDITDLQRRLLEELRSRLPEEPLEAWFRDLRIQTATPDEVELRVKSSFVRDWLRRNFMTQIVNSVREVTGEPHARVVLTSGAAGGSDELGGADAERPARGAAAEAVADAEEGCRAGTIRFEAGGSSNGASGGFPGGGTASPGVGHVPGGSAPRSSDDLNVDYTFDHFVVGACNRLAHAAAIAVGDNPGRAYNPLFIHGNVGLGKTHLLQATCHTIRRKQGSARVLYVSCEGFTNRYIEALQRSALEEFRAFHRSVDVLVIDDIEFLANKEKTQDEFFHTFNSLYNANRQIIISSDRSPAEIPTIEERLVSRFKWGLVAEITVPDFETRVAIVKRKALTRKLVLPDDVAYAIAESVDTNIRELEGAVIKVIGIASITEREIDVDLAREALRGVVVGRTRKISVPDVMEVVMGEFAISARELTGKGRTQAVSLPRQICMYLCRQLTDQSLEQIGRFFGNRDHTTVLYSVQKIDKRVQEDRVFRQMVASLSTRIAH